MALSSEAGDPGARPLWVAAALGQAVAGEGRALGWWDRSKTGSLGSRPGSGRGDVAGGVVLRLEPLELGLPAAPDRQVPTQMPRLRTNRVSIPALAKMRSRPRRIRAQPGHYSTVQGRMAGT